MRRILKFQIDKQATVLWLSHTAQILTCQEQDGEIMLWALVDEAAKVDERIFEIFGTGHEITYDMGVSRKYIATVQINELVWHVFEFNPMNV